MQSRNKDSVTIKKEANDIREAARSMLDDQIRQLKQFFDAKDHAAVDSEILGVLKVHKEDKKSLKGPDGLAAQAKKKSQYLKNIGNQKNILRFLTLHAAHDNLEQKLKKQVADYAIVMAAKRVHDLLHA